MPEIMDSKKIDRSLSRIAHEILERNREIGDLALIGIRTRGVFLAERLAEKVMKIEDLRLPVGILDITLYRDDLTSVGPQAVLKETKIPFPVDGKRPLQAVQGLQEPHPDQEDHQAETKAGHADDGIPVGPEACGPYVAVRQLEGETHASSQTR